MKTPKTLRRAAARAARGFTLVELMVTIAIVAILAAVAYPQYTQQVVRTRRAAATGCVTELAQFMERVYAGNIRYDQNNGAATALPVVPCRTELTGVYTFGFAASQPTALTFAVQAVPAGAQATRDARCGTLRIDQTNTRAITGTGTVADCWRR